MFDAATHTQLRTLGAGMLKSPFGVYVDRPGDAAGDCSVRVYVCDNPSKAVVVLDLASGARLATIAVPGDPRGVMVTCAGAIVVTHGSPKGMVIVESL